MNSLFEAIPFVENPLYERIISDISSQKYSIVDDFFSEDEVIALRHSLLLKYEEDAFKKSAIGNKTNALIKKAVRGDIILWIDEHVVNTAEKLFFNKINDLKDYLNRTCFLGINQKEFHYAIYPKGTYYQRHLDTFQNDDRRRLSFVCYLNSEDWQPKNGGELVLYLDREDRVIYPLPGKIVIFESQELEHEVKPVNTQRLSITGWLKTR
ncbi:2OG-Fe(II) oxygenase [Winogradskyella sediminis]|uniref:SM-20-related protein n=1 Tax=Winogradskyella sediminis TaxID=1382466 RepID=A0A1H1RQ59_9FLAO|nr:2OG-Fe(II) oxygenase [Winogradskyella sediminis]SDS37149.1 SM-20-related protein [Winogradskyella sediminis]